MKICKKASDKKNMMKIHIGKQSYVDSF